MFSRTSFRSVLAGVVDFFFRAISILSSTMQRALPFGCKTGLRSMAVHAGGHEACKSGNDQICHVLSHAAVREACPMAMALLLQLSL